LTDDATRAWEVRLCRGREACAFGLAALRPLGQAIEASLRASGWEAHLARRFPGGYSPHQRLRVAVAACPNACSQPQIQDIGLIAAARPTAVDGSCTACGACAQACREGAIAVAAGRASVLQERCVACGQCVARCPAAAIGAAPVAFRVLLGGHMGRHPAWATELTGTLDPQRAAFYIGQAALLLIRFSRPHERIWQTFSRLGLRAVADVEAALRTASHPHENT
jgi:dissimilatory sulfite reductase (desulfoviridin) alpha/beta subunit